MLIFHLYMSLSGALAGIKHQQIGLEQKTLPNFGVRKVVLRFPFRKLTRHTYADIGPTTAGVVLENPGYSSPDLVSISPQDACYSTG